MGKRSLQAAGCLEGEIGEYAITAGPLERQQGLQDHRLPRQPALLERRDAYDAERRIVYRQATEREFPTEATAREWVDREMDAAVRADVAAVEVLRAGDVLR